MLCVWCSFYGYHHGLNTLLKSMLCTIVWLYWRTAENTTRILLNYWLKICLSCICGSVCVWLREIYLYLFVYSLECMYIFIYRILINAQIYVHHCWNGKNWIKNPSHYHPILPPSFYLINVLIFDSGIITNLPQNIYH